MKEEDIYYYKYLAAVVIYAVLTWLWFDLNNSHSLPLIGHTELVYGWTNEYASKLKLLFDLIYFAISLAVLIIITEIALIKIPFIKFKKDSAMVASAFVNIIVFLYEFHVLEFRFKLIGLTIALIIFYVIGIAIADKVLTIVRPILGIMDIVDAVENINDVTKDKK